jgi:cell wall-associated NlpC family hydrolase
MKHIKTIEQFSLNEQLFGKEILKFAKLLNVSFEEEGGDEPNFFKAENPSGQGSPRIPIEKISTSEMDGYGATVGITDKSDNASLQQPTSGPIGNIVNSAYANLNVPTRKIPGTDGGNLGCAAAVSLVFYRATGYAIAGSGAITLGTSTMWNYFTKESEKPESVWKKITNWKTESQPGDIILTSRGTRPGHVGIVVDGGNVISNSSGGFHGDKKGQIELNYNLNSWDNVAQRNPSKTASFRYVGPYKATWDSQSAPIA